MPFRCIHGRHTWENCSQCEERQNKAEVTQLRERIKELERLEDAEIDAAFAYSNGYIAGLDDAKDQDVAKLIKERVAP